MRKYKAVLFDLFATVALWQPDRLPKFTWEGKSSPSTFGVIKALLAEHLPTLEFKAFHAALAAANDELVARRAQDMKEIPSKERFKLALTKAGLASDNATDELAQAISTSHLECLASAVHIPTEHTTFLKRVHADYSVALVSNFDHAPTARYILDRDGATPYFDHIVVSEDHGWRKPHTKIFADTLTMLNVGTKEALFVGDSVEDDIIGAKGAGMDAAWINARVKDLPAGVPTPDYVVGAIPDLAYVLFA